MTSIDGSILSGEYDEDMNVFMIQKVKNLYTETAIKEKQLHQLHAYLNKYKEDDEQIITLYDQLLVRLTSDEVQYLIHDIEKILSTYYA